MKNIVLRWVEQCPPLTGETASALAGMYGADVRIVDETTPLPPEAAPVVQQRITQREQEQGGRVVAIELYNHLAIAAVHVALDKAYIDLLNERSISGDGIPAVVQQQSGPNPWPYMLVKKLDAVTRPMREQPPPREPPSQELVVLRWVKAYNKLTLRMEEALMRAYGPVRVVSVDRWLPHDAWPEVRAEIARHTRTGTRVVALETYSPLAFAALREKLSHAGVDLIYGTFIPTGLPPDDAGRPQKKFTQYRRVTGLKVGGSPFTHRPGPFQPRRDDRRGRRRA